MSRRDVSWGRREAGFAPALCCAGGAGWSSEGGKRGRASRGHGGWQHHGGQGHGQGFGPFGRARRGMIKTAVFAALAEGPMHGYQIIQRIEQLSGGAWRPSPGSVYPTLQEFEDRGFVRSEEVEGKRVYALTELGAAEADKLRDTEGNLPWMEAEGHVGTRMKLRQSVGALAAATRQVGMSGSDETVEKTLEILADARRRIYALLAETE